MNNCCSWGHRPTKTDEPPKKPRDTNKNSSRSQESETQAPQRFENADSSEKAWKEKKKNNQKNRRDCRTQEGSTPATGVNTKTSGGGNSRRRNRPNPA